MTQVVEKLPSQNKILTSILSTAKKKKKIELENHHRNNSAIKYKWMLVSETLMRNGMLTYYYDTST
jgi:hypothetical protein